MLGSDPASLPFTQEIAGSSPAGGTTTPRRERWVYAEPVPLRLMLSMTPLVIAVPWKQPTV